MSFPVIGSRVASGNLYFQVKYQDHEYDIRAFDFQRQNRPKSLQCIVQSVDASGFPIFMQDISTIIPQIYEIGQTYEFRVASELLPAGYYEVADKNGLRFRLYPDKKEKHLKFNEYVKCRVDDINRMQMRLTLIDNREDEMPLYTLESFLALDSTSTGMERFMRYIFHTLPEFADAREQLSAKNPLWVITVADIVSNHLPEWLNASFNNNIGRKRLMLRSSIITGFNSICTNLLENSVFLRNCMAAERVKIQDRLNKIITHISDYIIALEKIITRREQDFIDQTLERLKLSGYLYKPEERMRVTMALFTLRKKTISQYIDDIFDIIRQSHSNTRFMHLFSNAFIEMLDMYIANESRHVDVLTSATDRIAIQQIIKALALRILLQSDETDTQRALYRSRLYRYVTLLTSVGADQLIGKTFSTLFNTSSPLEFSWKDLDDINLLCSKIAVSNCCPLSEQSLYYEGSNALLRISGDTLTFSPLERGPFMKYGIPKDLFSVHRINVLLNDRMQEKLKESRQDISQFRRLWIDVEHSLFGTRQNIRQIPKGIMPDVGDTVRVIITATLPGSDNVFKARIIDDGIDGEGTISLNQIVSYNIYTPLTADCFRNSETGQLCIFNAEVESIDDTTGQIQFKMRSLIHNYLIDALDSNDEPWLAKVTRIIPDYYLCITEGGFTIAISRRNVTLNLGDNINVQIDAIYPNERITGSYIERSEHSIQVAEAFKCLLDNYCRDEFFTDDVVDDDVDDSEAEKIDDDRNENTVIDPDMMLELIHIIDREGMLQKDHIHTYNYLAIARIMALMLNDSHLSAYFAKRMELVEAIKQFGESGIIDDDRLHRLLNDNKDFVASYPDIETRLTQLRIINNIDKSFKEDWLWEIARDNTEETTSHLARLVLSYNMLDRSNVYEVRRALHRKIYQLMGLNIQLPESMFVAEEDQFTELKTSIIYPAGNKMRPNEQEQVTEILRVISSFLNTRGGSLYVGVADTGYAVGLHNDFTYLNNRHENYDLPTIKDKFDRTVRDAVHNRLGRVANSKISTAFEIVGGKVIYRVDIDPSPEIAFVDGIAYERQGKSKWIIPAEDIEEFRKQRAREFNQQ